MGTKERNSFGHFSFYPVLQAWSENSVHCSINICKHAHNTERWTQRSSFRLSRRILCVTYITFHYHYLSDLRSLWRSGHHVLAVFCSQYFYLSLSQSNIIDGGCHKYHFCHDKKQTHVCHDKHMSVMTKHIFCHDKSMLPTTKLLSWQTFLSTFFIATKLLSQQILVETNMCLSW